MWRPTVSRRLLYGQRARPLARPAERESLAHLVPRRQSRILLVSSIFPLANKSIFWNSAIQLAMNQFKNTFTAIFQEVGVTWQESIIPIGRWSPDDWMNGPTQTHRPVVLLKFQWESDEHGAQQVLVWSISIQWKSRLPFCLHFNWPPCSRHAYLSSRLICIIYSFFKEINRRKLVSETS